MAALLAVIAPGSPAHGGGPNAAEIALLTLPKVHFHLTEHLMFEALKVELEDGVPLGGATCARALGELPMDAAWPEESLRAAAEACDGDRQPIPIGLWLLTESLPPEEVSLVTGLLHRLEHRAGRTPQARLSAAETLPVLLGSMQWRHRGSGDWPTGSHAYGADTLDAAALQSSVEGVLERAAACWAEELQFPGVVAEELGRYAEALVVVEPQGAARAVYMLGSDGPVPEACLRKAVGAAHYPASSDSRPAAARVTWRLDGGGP